jgi:hypothetical protein
VVKDRISPCITDGMVIWILAVTKFEACQGASIVDSSDPVESFIESSRKCDALSKD